MTNEKSALFKPLKVGKMELKHRIVMAPLTRFRAEESHTPSAEAIKYYEQRACVPGTLLITEASYISLEAGGMPKVPGIWNEDQIKAWKKITDAVHAKGSFIYIQLWALGRAAQAGYLAKFGKDVVSSSDVPLGDNAPKPRPLTAEEIKQYIDQYGIVAKHAIEAGFDGVEVHTANGYLPDQFTQDTANQRTDQYGGSIENRTRFAREAIESCVKAIGADRVACRLSPYSSFQGMKMDDPIPTFSHLIKSLPQDLAYLHLVESRINGNADVAENKLEVTDFARDLWKGPFFTAGGYRTDSAVKVADKNEKTAVVIGRYFISNPDLVAKVKLDEELRPYDRHTFYTNDYKGYTDYPVDEQLLERASRL